jgi:O-antigen/teichoic acid export membrane protein
MKKPKKLPKDVRKKVTTQVRSNWQFIHHLGSSYMLMGVNIVTMFILTPILFSHLGKEGYGIWIALTAVAAYFSLSNFGFTQTFLIELIKNKDNPKKANRLINTAFFSLMMFLVVTLPPFLLVQYNIGPWFKITEGFVPDAQRAFVIVYGIFILNFLGSVFQQVIFGFGKLTQRNLIEALRVLLNFGLTLLVIQTYKGLMPVLIINFLTTLIYLAAAVVLAYKQVRFKIHLGHFHKPTFNRFLVPSMHFFILGMSSQIILYSDSILISTLSGVSAVAFYAITFRIPDQCQRLIFKISDVKIPKITLLHSQGRYFELMLLHNRLFWLTVAIAFPVAAVLILAGPWVIETWMRQQFEVDFWLVVIFTSSMVTQVLIHVEGVFIQSMELHKKMAWFTLAGAAFHILLAILLHHFIGLRGIALSFLISQTIVGLSVVGQLYSFIGQNLGEGRSFSFFKLRNAGRWTLETSDPKAH